MACHPLRLPDNHILTIGLAGCGCAPYRYSARPLRLSFVVRASHSNSRRNQCKVSPQGLDSVAIHKGHSQVQALTLYLVGRWAEFVRLALNLGFVIGQCVSFYLCKIFVPPHSAVSAFCRRPGNNLRNPRHASRSANACSAWLYRSAPHI